MGELHEIVEVAAIERWFLLLAVVGPLVGTAIGAVVGSRNGQTQKGAVSGLGVGAFATLNWLLWRVYNALTDKIGLDTVANVVVNLVLFAALGVGIGFVLSRKRGSVLESVSASEEVPS